MDDMHEAPRPETTDGIRGQADAFHSRPCTNNDPHSDYCQWYYEETRRLRLLGRTHADKGLPLPDDASTAYYDGYLQLVDEVIAKSTGKKLANQEIEQGITKPKLPRSTGSIANDGIFLEGYLSEWNDHFKQIGQPLVSARDLQAGQLRGFVRKHPVVIGVALASAALVTFQFSRVVGNHFETGGEQAVSDCALDYQTPAEIALDQLRVHGNVPDAKASAPEAVEALSLNCSPEQSARTLARVEDLIDTQGEAVVTAQASTTTTQPGQGIGD